MKKPSQGVFVTGTDTEVGKTFVACRMLEYWRSQGRSVGAYKPVASGASSMEESDAFHLWNAIGRSAPMSWVNPQTFEAPLAPPIAAELEGRRVDDQLLIAGLEPWSDQCEFLLIEGAGGLLSPISWTTTNADLAKSIDYPVVIVARNRLGAIHQILATVWVAARFELTIAEIVLNDTSPSDCSVAAESNQRLLEPFLARIPFRNPCQGKITIRREGYCREGYRSPPTGS